jgi:hypothetical protein
MIWKDRHVIPAHSAFASSERPWVAEQRHGLVDRLGSVGRSHKDPDCDSQHRDKQQYQHYRCDNGPEYEGRNHNSDEQQTSRQDDSGQFQAIQSSERGA